MMSDIFEGFKTKIGVIQMWGTKNAPTILTVAGAISVVAGTVVACVKTKNMSDILEKRNDRLEELDQEYKENKLDEKEYRSAVRKSYVCWALRIGKNYAIPAAIEVLGLAMIFKGHGMLLTSCASLSTLLTEALDREKALEDRIREEYGNDALLRLKYGDPVTLTREGEDCDPITTFEYDEGYDWDFKWTSGMGEYSDTDEKWNDSVRRKIQMWIQNSQQLYGSYGAINDIYKRFGAFDKIRSEYDFECIGFPNLMLAPGYTCGIELQPIEGTTNKKKTCPDYWVHFIRKPIPCKEMNIEAHFRAA